MFPQQSSIHDSFTSHTENSYFPICCTLFNMGSGRSFSDDFTLHDGNQLFQCLQSFLRGHIVNTSVSATKRSTTDRVARSNSLRYHVNVKQCDDTFCHSK